MSQLSSQNYLDEIKTKWVNAHKYMMELTANTPDSLYHFRPTGESMTLQEQIIHTGSNMIRLSNGQLQFNKIAKPEINVETASPEETRSYLDAAFKYALQAIENESDASLNTISQNFFAGPKSHRQIINVMNDHVAHHRGQIIVYLRLNGISPPRYVGW
ncbi:DinB family protein [Membranihabitans maritimus]|uniref:DinB family protein n=1 Tax=Membranihabitans maritimus TaxID=2904244 RepID=UPI001F3E9FC5|nr:DinB family protein [Membranihabitans maritimus]